MTKNAQELSWDLCPRGASRQLHEDRIYIHGGHVIGGRVYWGCYSFQAVKDGFIEMNEVDAIFFNRESLRGKG